MVKNKTKRTKFITGIATAAMVATAVVPVASAAGFTDIGSIDASVKAEIHKAVDLGFFNDGTTFNPSVTINRGQAALTLARYIAGESTVKQFVDLHGLENNVTPFTDIPVSYKTGQVYQQELYYASLVVKQAGAFTQSTLNPTGKVSRSQMAKIITQTFGLVKEQGYNSSITDIAHLDAGTKNYIETIASHGITNVTTFMPAGQVTRSQMASFLVRSYDVVHNQLPTSAVKSVKSINATQVEVEFGMKVDELTATGTPGNYTFTALDGQTTPATVGIAAELKADGKTVLLTVDQPLDMRYQVKTTGILAEDGITPIANYNEVVKFIADTTAPTVTTVERISTNKMKIKFSEPVQAGTITEMYADGSPVSPALALTLTGGETELEVDLSNAGIIMNKDIEVTLNGVRDMAGNLISPQPTKVTVVKEPLDGIEPTIATVTQTGAKKFTLNFNKKLDGTLASTDVTLTGGAMVQSIQKISASEYEVTVNNNLNGLQTVTVAAGKAIDLSGQTNTAPLTKLVTFVQDLVAPQATSQIIEVNNKEYLEMTFDKNIDLVGDTMVTIAGSKVKNFVTSAVPATNVLPIYANPNNKKVILLPLTHVNLAEENAAYTVTIVNKTANVNGVQSESGVDMVTANASFTRGVDGTAPNTDKVTAVTVAQGSTPDEVDVTFTIPTGASLDGATATDLANYSIAGATIQTINLAAASGTSQIATLKLLKNSNTFTGVRNINVANVKVAGSTTVMNPVAITNVSLLENVMPTVTKAEVLTATTIELTFSENVALTGTTNFDVFLGGSTTAETGVSTVAGTTTNMKTVITLTTPLTGTDPILVKPSSTIDVKDAAGNLLDLSSIGVTQ